jgi:hypothetical protein
MSNDARKEARLPEITGLYNANNGQITVVTQKGKIYRVNRVEEDDTAKAQGLIEERALVDIIGDLKEDGYIMASRQVPTLTRDQVKRLREAYNYGELEPYTTEGRINLPEVKREVLNKRKP